LVTRTHLAALGLCAVTAACSLDDRPVAFVAAGGRDAGASSGAGGAGGEPAAGGGGEAGAGAHPLCTGIPAEQALITDFSDALEVQEDDEGNPGVGFGFPLHRYGGISFVWALTGLDLPRVSLAGAGDADERAMRVVAQPRNPLSQEYASVGFGLGWFGCVDATEYAGVAFTLKGTLGTCQLYTGLNGAQTTRVELNEDGSCELADFCFPPSSGPIETEGTYEIPFEDIRGGNPRDAIDPARILGFNWGLSVPLEGTPCDADFTVDDVRFFR